MSKENIQAGTNTQNQEWISDEELSKYASTPEVTTTAGNVREKTPFYYDDVLINNLTSISLHANSVLKGDDWGEPTELTDSEGYMVRPLIKAPLLEDYTVLVGNRWTEFGDDALGKFWNNLKPFAPYVGHISKVVSEIMSTNSKIEESEGPISESSFFGITKNVISKLGEIAEKGEKVLNRSLVAQGARFSYYSGSDTSFGNLSMKFTVFSGWNSDLETGQISWTTVNDQLQPLYPYLIGKYKNGVANFQEGDLGMSGETAGQANEIINEFLSWQLPPGGYKPDTKNVDNVQFGTLKLKFGSFYSLSSLVCTNAQFNFSKQMVKYWDSGKEKNVLSPLYCDVIINFQPSTKYSDDSLKRFISGGTMESEIKSMKSSLKTFLDKEKDKNTKLLSGT